MLNANKSQLSIAGFQLFRNFAPALAKPLSEEELPENASLEHTITELNKRIEWI